MMILSWYPNRYAELYLEAKGKFYYVRWYRLYHHEWRGPGGGRG